MSFAATGEWSVNPRVAIRPETFGALLYHFGNRRLSFLKDPRLLIIVASLEEHSSAREACAAAGVTVEEQQGFEAALERLAESDMIVRREAGAA